METDTVDVLIPDNSSSEPVMNNKRDQIHEARKAIRRNAEKMIARACRKIGFVPQANDYSSFLDSQQLDEFFERQVECYSSAFSLELEELVSQYVQAKLAEAKERQSQCNEIDLSQFEDVDIAVDDGEAIALELDGDTPIRIETEIRRVMREKQITQSALAKKIGVQPPAISKFLKSITSAKLSTITRVAQALEIDLQLFFRRIDHA